MNSKSLRELITKVGYTDDWKLFNLRIKGDVKGEYRILSLWFSYKIARFTDMFTEEVRDFFFNKASYKELYEKYGISEGVLKNNIFRQVKRYYQYIGTDIYYGILEGKISEEEAKVFAEDLKLKFDSLKKVNIRIEDLFYEDIFSGSRIDHNFTSITNEQFNEARDKVSRLSIEATQFLINNLDVKLKDYIVYLLTTDDKKLISTDRERKENLILFLKLEKYFVKEGN
jgi:hypothetical protein